MQNETLTASTEHVAVLNDLLQLDRDAVQAYTLAIKELRNASYQETIRSFRTDHERHIRELSEVITGMGGKPAAMPHASGVFKLALQTVAGLGDDTAVLMAFRANERQVRDKYQRAADGVLAAEAGGVVLHAAADEARHFDWADRTLRQLGYTESDFERSAARMHQRTADLLERGERAVRGSIRSNQAAKIAGSALAVIGVGAVLARVLRR